MPSISLRKIFLVLLIIFLFSRTGKITRFLSSLDIGGWIYDSFAPLHDGPPLARFIAVLLLLLLIYLTLFKLLQKRK